VLYPFKRSIRSPRPLRGTLSTAQRRLVLFAVIAVGVSLGNAHANCAFKVGDAAAAPTTAKATIDGLLLMRYARGASDNALTANITTTLTATDVANHVRQNLATLDINDNGVFDEYDALIIERYLVGMRGAALLPTPATIAPAPLRTTGDAAQAFIDLGCPAGLRVAALGAPRVAPINGLATVLDANHRVAKHALDATFEAAPIVAGAMPMITPIKALVRRDALIVYLPNVQGAADYRVFVDTVDGRKVIACAGYRQRASIAREDTPGGNVVRELLQTVELPGLPSPGNYRIIVEAIDRACPFTGMPAHTSALIPILQGTPLRRMARLAGTTIPFISFNDSITQYGAEIINGQGATSNFILQAGQTRGQAVPPMSADATPVVIARSAIRVITPFADEAVNAPNIDVGPNSIFDDFSSDAVASFSRIAARSFGGSDAIEGSFGNWYFWGTSAQSAVGQSGTDQPLGVQAWRRHGRLNITMADWSQEPFAAVHFTSNATKPLALDSSTYAHSFFRVDSGATGRRYWHWMMCGANDVTTLVDPATNIPRIRHLLRSDFFQAGGVNPTEPLAGVETLTANHRRECLSVFHRATGNPPTPTLPGGGDGPRPNQEFIVTVNPEGANTGVINLAPAAFDRGYGENAFRWRLDAANNYAGPLLEPFDQQQPLTHYDVFTRKDRVVVFINGRQGFCIDLTPRPLTMNFGLIVYGQVLYHTDAEIDEYYLPTRPADKPYQPPYGSFHLSMNTVAADSRAWDAVGHTEKIGIPALFNFDASLCKPPGNIAVQ
jgi:hypothetical protein